MTKAVEALEAHGDNTKDLLHCAQTTLFELQQHTRKRLPTAYLAFVQMHLARLDRLLEFRSEEAVNRLIEIQAKVIELTGIDEEMGE